MSSPPCGHPKEDGGHRASTPHFVQELTEAPELPLPLFGEEISMALHESGLATLGVGINHGVAVALLTQAALDASEKLPHGEWWGALQKIKTITQWRQQLVSLGAQEAEIENLGQKQIGEFMFSRITEEGTVAGKSLQTIKIP